ncbi:ATP-binding protein [Streptomyces sp. NPDC000880]
MERILINPISNAQHHSPSGKRVVVTASAHSDRVEIRVIDHDPGIPARPTPPETTARLPNSTRRSRGLAGAEPWAEALASDETPGGGITMILSLPAVTRQ